MPYSLGGELLLLKSIQTCEECNNAKSNKSSIIY
ncbi:hypothetical protein [Peribacillus frigoritolerans]